VKFTRSVSYKKKNLLYNLQEFLERIKIGGINIPPTKQNQNILKKKIKKIRKFAQTKRQKGTFNIIK
jgi:hypothetical protein